MLRKRKNYSIFITLIIPIVLLVLVSASCRSTKKIQTAMAKKDSVITVLQDTGHEDSLAFIKNHVEDFKKNYINFTTFSSKINVDYYSADGKKYDVNVFVRMYRDSVIWFSVNGALGIEGMRALITKDSVFILNKLDKVYQARSISYLEEIASIPLDLRSMEDLIIGNPVFLSNEIISYEIKDNLISMLSNGKWFRHLVTMNRTDHLLVHSKLDDINPLKNRTASLAYDSYEDKKGLNFSTIRSISITEKSKLDIDLKFKQYAFNETLSFPFNIPKNYKKG